MSAAAQPVQARSERSGAWLYGRWVDLFLGCGLAYLAASPLVFAIARATGAEAWPAAWVLWFGLLISGPHYGATILRVYETREERRKYSLFAVYVTLALALVFVAATRSLLLASILVTAYLTWSPWHFSGQNYGLSLMFLRRRGIDIDPTSKRLIYASFVLSALLAILAIHGGYNEFVFAPATLPVAETPSVLPLRLPAAFATPLFGVLFAIYLGCLAVAGRRLLRRAPLADLAPSILLVLTQSLWFTMPAFEWSPVRGQSLVLSAVWISTWHSIQYLWITAYYASSSGRREPAMRFLAKATVAGAGVTVLPGLVMSPQWLGVVPWDAGLAVTVFSIVNLHHFIIDGAIWKLRDGRVARVLLRAPDASQREDARTASSRPWLRGLVWATAALCLMVPLSEIVARAAIQRGGEPEQLRRWTRLLGWVGRETTQQHYWLGRYHARLGLHAQAIAEYERGIELFPTGRTWFALANEYRALGRWELARAAYESAIALNPEIAAFHVGRAEALLALARAESGDATRDEAKASLERALALRPGYAQAAVKLARLYAGTGQGDRAVHTLESALAADDPSGERAIREALSQLQP